MQMQKACFGRTLEYKLYYITTPKSPRPLKVTKTFKKHDFTNTVKNIYFEKAVQRTPAVQIIAPIAARMM